jgi:sugar phosphate isomerase/epimerase
MSIGIKLGTKKEISTIFKNDSLYTCFGIYELPTTIIDEENISLLRAAFNKGIRFIVHAPHPFNAGIDIASLDQKTRKKSIDCIKDAIDIADKLSAEAVVIHCGLTNDYRKIEKGILKAKRSRRDALQAAKESLLKLVQYLKGRETCLTVENDAALPSIEAESNKTRFDIGTLCVTAEEIVSMLDGLRNLGVTFDIGHAYGSAKYLRKDPYVFMRKIINSIGIEKIRNIHLSDIAASIDYHVAVGEGSIDYNRVFPLLEDYAGPVIFENFPLDIYKSLEKTYRFYNSFLVKHGKFDLEKTKKFCMKLGWIR